MRRKYLFTNALDMLKFVRIRYQRPIASKERYFTMSNVCFTVASSGRIRPHNWRLPFACGIAGIFSIVHQTAPSIAFMEQTKGKNESQIMEEDNAEDLECPFCRYFLNSHCREEFKVWQRCVKVKEALECQKPFMPLHKCMIKNDMYTADEELSSGYPEKGD